MFLAPYIQSVFFCNQNECFLHALQCFLILPISARMTLTKVTNCSLVSLQLPFLWKSQMKLDSVLQASTNQQPSAPRTLTHKSSVIETGICGSSGAHQFRTKEQLLSSHWNFFEVALYDIPIKQFLVWSILKRKVNEKLNIFKLNFFFIVLYFSSWQSMF